MDHWNSDQPEDTGTKNCVPWGRHGNNSVNALFIDSHVESIHKCNGNAIVSGSLNVYNSYLNPLK